MPKSAKMPDLSTVSKTEAGEEEKKEETQNKDVSDAEEEMKEEGGKKEEEEEEEKEQKEVNMQSSRRFLEISTACVEGEIESGPESNF